MLIETFPRSLMLGHASYQWQLMKDEVGYFVQQYFDVEKLTAEERAEYEKELASMPPEQPTDNEEYEYYFSQIPRFPTIELAREWAAYEDRLINTDDDLHAFGAPSECYADAHRGLERREKELLSHACKQV